MTYFSWFSVVLTKNYRKALKIGHLSITLSVNASWNIIIMKSFVGSLAQICLMGQIMKSNLNLNLNLIFHEQDAIKKD